MRCLSLRISQSKIDEIASAVDIVEIISQYTNLRKAGRSFMGRCPFHEERTPSFSVSQEKGVYHCFGCGKSGNVFTFIMDMDNVSFFDSVKTLAEKANIELEFYDEPDEDRNQIEALYEINKQAARFYFDTLMSHDGIYAKEYLEHRGIKEDMLPKFGLGFSLRYKDTFYQKFKDKFRKEDLLASGLVYGEEPKDKFRGRLMFPIISESGRVIAFGARKLFDDDYVQAKYVNSPETKIYNKSKTLYGLSFAKNSIKEKGYVILVEGYLDLISLVQNGILNVAASSGTSLTNLHVKIFSRYTNEIVIVYDADTAGQNAARRAIELILENDMQASIIVLPSGEDPDSYLRKNTQEAFRELINKRQNFISYIGQTYKNNGKLDTPEGNADFIREIISIIAKMPNQVERDSVVKDISQRFSIYERIIQSELYKLLINKKEIQINTFESYNKSENINLNKTNPVITTSEHVLIKLLVDSDNEVKKFLLDNLEIDMIRNKKIVKIINYIYENVDNPKLIKPSNLYNEFNDIDYRNILNILFVADNFLTEEENKYNNIDNAKKVLIDLRISYLEEEVNKLEELKGKIINKDNPETRKMAMKYHEYNKELNVLYKERRKFI